VLVCVKRDMSTGCVTNKHVHNDNCFVYINVDLPVMKTQALKMRAL